MNKIKFMLATALVAAMGTFVSCTQDEDFLGDTHYVNQKTIGFNICQDNIASTRSNFSSLANSTDWQDCITDFDVWASFSKEAIGSGVSPYAFYIGEQSENSGERVGINGPVCEPESLHVWPAATAPLDFYAITPSYQSLSDEQKSCFSSHIVYSGNPNIDPIVDVYMEVNINIPDQKEVPDYMIASKMKYTVDSYNAIVPLHFKHLLSNIEIKARIGSYSTTYGVRVLSVNLHNICTGIDYSFKNGECVVSDNTKADDGSTAKGNYLIYGTWWSGSVLPAKSIYIDGQTISTTINDMIAVVPQNNSSVWDGNDVQEAIDNKLPYIEVKYLENASKSNPQKGTIKTSYIPLDCNWEQGKKYTYTLTFDLPSIGFNIESVDNMSNGN